ncbi:hypothetical protein QZH41_017798 [Actinostola sp. cb2023]|nr:hypothetical protein QZH41_017798 [Actinostola sp. cb2023]
MECLWIVLLASIGQRHLQKDSTNKRMERMPGDDNSNSFIQTCRVPVEVNSRKLQGIFLLAFFNGSHVVRVVIADEFYGSGYGGELADEREVLLMEGVDKHFATTDADEEKVFCRAQARWLVRLTENFLRFEVMAEQHSDHGFSKIGNNRYEKSGLPPQSQLIFSKTKMEDKINALKDFAMFGSSKKTSSNDKIHSNSTPSSPTSQNGQWGSWFKKAEEDPYLPSLAGFIAPFIVLKARKFVMLYTMGSLFTIGRACDSVMMLMIIMLMMMRTFDESTDENADGQKYHIHSYFCCYSNDIFSMVLCELYPWWYDWYEVLHKVIFICCNKDCFKYLTSIV